jgi:alpha-2-macroglobulin
MVVDDNVLLKTDHDIKNPISFFYTHRNENLESFHSRDNVLYGTINDLAKILPPKPIESQENFDSDEENGNETHLYESGRSLSKQMLSSFEIFHKTEEEPPVAKRNDLDALILFAPSLITNEKGECSIKLKFPENLTKYRQIFFFYI